ncbi:MAG: hypothetical protein PUI84_04745 [Bacteroidales bacterium]|nr:hypothetical protein [Porphyromonas sp.]MDD6934613.1 hypothetical protein [Bacteroidales bacterium]MDY3101797.1 hypothetical protein [Porphyromonas sp.]
MKRLKNDLSVAIRILLFGVLVLLQQSLRGQEVGISTSISPSEIQIGETAIIDITIRTSDLANTYLINPTDTAQLRAEPLALEITDTVDMEGGLKELHARMAITSFDSTLVVIPAFGVRVGDKEAFAKPLTLKVNLPKVDMEHPDQFFDIKDVWDIPYTWQEILLIALPWLIAVFVLLGIFFGYRYYNRYKQRKALQQPDAPVPSLTMWELFVKDVEALNARSLPEKGMIREYYTELDLLSRSFIHQAVGIDTLEMTSRQLLRALQKAGYGPFVEKVALEDLVERGDLAKFAKVVYRPEEAISDSRKWLDVARGFYQLQQKQGDTEEPCREEKGDSI